MAPYDMVPYEMGPKQALLVDKFLQYKPVSVKIIEKGVHYGQFKSTYEN